MSSGCNGKVKICEYSFWFIIVLSLLETIGVFVVDGVGSVIDVESPSTVKISLSEPNGFVGKDVGRRNSWFIWDSK